MTTPWVRIQLLDDSCQDVSVKNWNPYQMTFYVIMGIFFCEIWIRHHLKCYKHFSFNKIEQQEPYYTKKPKYVTRMAAILKNGRYFVCLAG